MQHDVKTGLWQASNFDGLQKHVFLKLAGARFDKPLLQLDTVELEGF